MPADFLPIMPLLRRFDASYVTPLPRHCRQLFAIGFHAIVCASDIFAASAASATPRFRHADAATPLRFRHAFRFRHYAALMPI